MALLHQNIHNTNIRSIIIGMFGVDLTMDLKEIKKLAEELDDSGKRELVYYLQSRMKLMSAPIRAIDEIQEQKHKDGLVCPHCESHSVVRFGKYVIKTRAGEVKRQRYRCKSCRQTFQRPHEYTSSTNTEDPIFGFDSLNS